jgi:hypothetical protein
MRGLILAFLILLSCGATLAAAQQCTVGEEVTLEGEIITPPIIDAGYWFMPGKPATKPCEVVTLRGKGDLPEECVVGKRMSLTGKVVNDGIIVLETSEIKCE